MADAGDRATAPPNHRKPHGSGQPRPHPPHGSQHAPRNYKTLSDKDLGAKETIRRYNGHIPGHPKYDVKLPLSDPRNQYIRYRVVPPADLNVPTFTIDRNTLFCPKIEVAVFKLNDNVSKAFLHQLVSKIAPPVDLEVFYHPVTKKHMGMAMIVFNSFNEARKFVLEYDGKSIMGGQVSCCHDPYFALLSQRFEDATGEEMRIPVHLKTLEETILNTRRSQLASKHRALMQANQSTFPPEPTVGQSDDVMDVDSPAVSVEPATPRNMEKALEPLTPSLDLPAPRTLTARPRTPLLDPPPPPTPSLDGPSLVGHPLPNAFAPHVPPPPVPMFHSDFNAPHLQPGPSNLPPPMPPLTPGFCPLAYPPPPPYSVLPPGGSTQFPPNYLHLPVTQPLPGASSAPISEEKAAPHTPRTPAETSRNKKDGRARQSKKKKKKRRRHSSDSSSDSSSSSSLNVGEYLRVEKKEMSTKYISREREGLEKTIVEEIKTVTKKKKYRLTESKRNDAKTAGLQLVSSDESVEQHEGDDVDGEREKRTVAPGGEREKKEVHRWSSSSTDSEGDRIQKKEKKNEKLTASTSLADSTTQAPAAMVLPPPPPPSMFMSPPRAANHSLPPPGPVPPSLLPPPHMGLPLPPPGTLPLMPTHLPPPFPLPPMNPSLVGGPPFNPLLPPPNFSIGQPPPPAFPKRAFPKVSLRFVEDSAPPPSKSSTAPLSKSSAPPQPTLADRVASIFGGEPHLASPSKAQPEPSTSAKHHRSNDAASDDVDDMDVDVGSSMSPPDASPSPCLSENRLSRSSIRKKRRRKHRGTSDKKMSRFMRNVKAVREATEKVIGEEIVDVITKDFYKRIEGVSFEILEEVLAEIRHELEEQKRNEAQQALRAQAEIVTTEKPSDVSQLCSPLGAVSASLNTTPEKLGSFPFTINMPKLPSFKRKVRPPSPDSESSRSPVARKRDAESESDDSDAAQKSSSCSRRSDSSEEIVLRKKQGRHYRSPSVSGSESSSEISSSEAEANRSKSSASGATLVREDALSVSSTAASTASSIASSESSPASEAEDHDDRDASTVTDEPRIPTPEPPKKEEVEIPLWTKIISSSSMDWCESLPGSSYHVNLTEHCYFKLPPEGEEQVRKTGDVVKVEVIKPPTPLKKGRLSKQDRELLGLFPTAEVRAPPPRPKIVYPPWSHEDNIKHIGQWDCCFDPEDQDYLKQAWMQLQPSGENATLPPWGKALRFNFWSWADKPNLLEKPVKKGRLDQYFADSELDGILPIQDGCARTRGYFKMSMKEKRRLIRRPEDEQRDKTVISERDEAAVRHNLVLTKESRSMHRRLLTTMGDTNTDFFKVNQLKYRKKMIKFARSRIHGWGLYAMEPIAPDDMIVEYVGQKVRNTVADVREKAYERRGIGSSYLFRIDDTTVIDATRMGNFARFINHSCQPNCYAKVVTVDGDKRIVIYSKTLINKGDEITYDYKFPIEEDKVDCLCGAPNCRGTLN